MTWLELANLLFEESKPLSPLGAHLHLDTAAWLRTWTPYQNRTADAAAAHFAQHRRWPAMEPECACQLYFRCLFAIEACIEAQASQSPPPATLDEERCTIESILAKQWNLSGIDWAERRYRAKPSRGARLYA